jgi:lipid-A-disaccharide synthase
VSDVRAAAPGIMLVAGEASGDLHGAALCRALRAERPECRLFGMGGARMAAAGMDLLVDVTAAAAAGTSEALGRVPLLWRAYKRLSAILEGDGRPRVLVVIDFPEFNLRLARAARRAGVPVVYFVPPQIWAWRGGRVRTIRRLISLVLAVFPFETALYRRAGVRVEFVGHPVLDAVAGAPERAAARSALGLAEGAVVVGLLPGSRREELARGLPLMREAAAIVAARRPEVRFLAALAPTTDPAEVRARLGAAPRVDVVSGGTYAVMRAADLVLVTSGTATLEAGVLGTPMVVCYRFSRVSALVARLLIRVPWFSLPNLALGREVVPELFQEEATGERLGRAALRLLETPGALAAQRAALAELARGLGEPGVGQRAARLVLAEAGAAG